jgi:hypothetical protein
MAKIKKDIEVELRGEIRAGDIPALGRRLKAKGFKLEKRYRRTMAMSFGYVQGRGEKRATGKPQWADLRCRITNGKAEIMCKIGEGAAHNRREISVPVSKSDFLRFAEMFGSMGFFTKVGTREGITYRKGKTQVALVKSPSGLAYVELEIMSDRAHEEKDVATLRTLAQELELTLMPGEKEFFAFCDRLTKQDDWLFKSTPADIKRLARAIL